MSSPETTLPAHQYRCEACGEVFDKGWSDENARAELGENFPDFRPDDCALVCDDCFKSMGFAA